MLFANQSGRVKDLQVYSTIGNRISTYGSVELEATGVKCNEIHTPLQGFVQIYDLKNSLIHIDNWNNYKKMTRKIKRQNKKLYKVAEIILAPDYALEETNGEVS